MIIANWKMNGSKELIENWIDVVSRDIEINQSKECIFCPPACYLDFTGTQIQKTSKNILTKFIKKIYLLTIKFFICKKKSIFVFQNTDDLRIFKIRFK